MTHKTTPYIADNTEKISTSDEKTFEQIFKILLEGTPTEIKEAKSRIDTKWKTDDGEFRKCTPLFFDYLNTFDSITNPINKAGFISGIRLFYLILANDHFPILKDFIVKNLQDTDGRIREAARNTGEWLLSPLLHELHHSCIPKEPI
jgi:hypothetical protein